MGVNMRIFHCYGVKQKKLNLSEDTKSTYENNFCDMFYDSSFMVQSEKPVIFDDCYNGEWEFFGQIIHSSHDYRHDGWDDFEWEISNADENDEIDELCRQYGLPEPKHYVITYYS